jgi:hypothetical protein
LLAVTCLAVVIVLAAAAPALALTIETEGTVFAEKCLPCHARIAESKSSEIIFTHGLHILIACSSCHSEFPHRPEGTDTPKMPECWNCHGLSHGPQGELATGKCPDCHRTPEDRLRPTWHTYDWAEAPHVEPGEEQLQTLCMMCHDGESCDECHEEENVVWMPDEAYVFDARDGCMACHGNENLIKISEGEAKSFEVTGVEDSAHTDLTCQDCHPDFKYEEGLDATNLWTVNAGLACMDCHAEEDTREAVGDTGDVSIVDDYRGSIHGEELAQANYDSATCSSCHGGHYIERLDTEANKAAFHQDAYRVCARCHLEQWESYDDYYHGAAYKVGAPDAPACWDCHGDHHILPSADAESLMSDENKPGTCGGAGAGELNCHADSTEEFVEAAGDLIHQRGETREENPLARFFGNLFGWLG